MKEKSDMLEVGTRWNFAINDVTFSNKSLIQSETFFASNSQNQTRHVHVYKKKVISLDTSWKYTLTLCKYY